jgi:hypothetical protein
MLGWLKNRITKRGSRTRVICEFQKRIRKTRRYRTTNNGSRCVRNFLMTRIPKNSFRLKFVCYLAALMESDRDFEIEVEEFLDSYAREDWQPT